MDTDALRDLLAKATPGPWGWFDDNRASSPYLATVNRGRVYVMGFVRRGMNAAQPEFQVREGTDEYGVMRSAAEIGTDWPKHPDAALIVAAVNALPGLLDRLDELEPGVHAVTETAGLLGITYLHDGRPACPRCRMPLDGSDPAAKFRGPSTETLDLLDRLERFSHRAESDGKVDAAQLRQAIQALREETSDEQRHETTVPHD